MGEERLKVFIAEDESVILTSFQLMVKLMGHRIAGTAMDGEEALRGIRETDPDLILMDINLPRRDGLNVLEELCGDKLIPSVIVSGEFSDELVERANRVGVFGYLLKPIDDNQLKITIDVAIRRFREFKETRDEKESLHAALAERKEIEKAKGILMDRFGLKEAEAMRRLQKKSRDGNQKLIAVARDIIRADRLLDS